MDASALSELTKDCPDCGESKPVSMFYAKSGRTEEWHTYCKPCMSVRNKEADLKRKYGISLNDLKRMEAEQGFKCAICGQPPCKLGLMVDHNHSTGVTRELLCNSCNTGIGMLKEDKKIINAALEYLEKWNV